MVRTGGYRQVGRERHPAQIHTAQSAAPKIQRSRRSGAVDVIAAPRGTQGDIWGASALECRSPAISERTIRPEPIRMLAGTRFEKVADRWREGLIKDRHPD